MSTRGELRTAITGDLADQTKSSEITKAIAEAIRFYQRKRLWFSETREKTFQTVAGQTWYSKAYDADIGTIKKLDAVVLELTNNDFPLRQIDGPQLELITDGNASSAQPTHYAYYGQQIGLFPIPNAAFTVRLMGHFTVDGPLTDEEEDNPWMVEAFELIRARCVREIAFYKHRDYTLAQAAQVRENEALDALEMETERRLSSRRLMPTEF